MLSCSEISPSRQRRCNHQGGQTRVCKHAALNMTYYSNYMTHFLPLIMQVPSCSSETPIHQEKSKLQTLPAATAVPVLLSGDISKAYHISLFILNRLQPFFTASAILCAFIFPSLPFSKQEVLQEIAGSRKGKTMAKRQTSCTAS